VTETAVFGGSFDPPHAAHVLVVSYVLSTAPVDRVLVVPLFEHTLGKKARASFAHRFRMCELAMAPLRGVEISPIEEELSGPSYTLETLEELRRRDPSGGLRLVVGADILAETHRWHRWDAVTALAPPIVIGRAGYPPPAGARVELPMISSTDLRERLAAGRETEGLLPRRVADYIAEHGLYRAAP
jgi:nicotinate-nucleotide adenylyltransferase